MGRFGTAGGFVIAIFLLILGVLLISGLLNFLLGILGAICIVAAIVVGAMALLGGNRNRF